MVRTLVVLSVLAAACGKVSHDGNGDGDGGTGGGDGGGGGADADPITDLSVTLEVGSGGGAVTSDVGGIDCGSSCDATLDTGTQVTLTATPDDGSAFVAWRGLSARDCRRATECTITTTGGPQPVGALFAEKGTSGWALQVGSSVGDSGGQLIIDKNGDLIFAAQYGAQFDFGGESYENLGSADIFLAKLSPGGEVIWAKGFGGAAYDTPAFIATDPATGDVVLGGYYQAPIDFGGPEPLAIADSEDMFVVKLSGADGSYIWQKPIEVSDNDGPGFEGLAVDGSGNVLVLGHFNTSINLGSTDLTSTDQEMFFARLKGADGAVDWQRKLGGPNYPIPTQMVVDGNGNPIMIGTFNNAIDLAGDGSTGDMTALGVTDAFVAKFAGNNGSLTWQKQIGSNEDNDGGGNDSGYGIALGPNNSVVVVVNYRVMAGQTVDFLGNTLAGSGTGIDLVVGRISASGGFVWAKRYGGGGQEYGYKPALFQDGRVAVAGYFTADFSMNGQALALEGANYDSFFAVLAASNGSASWAARVGSLVADNGTWSAGFDDQLYGTGVFQGDGSFLGKSLTNVGSSDVYLFMVPLP